MPSVVSLLVGLDALREFRKVCSSEDVNVVASPEESSNTRIVIGGRLGSLAAFVPVRIDELDEADY